MKFYIDSANIDDIVAAMATGYVYGVTTNPTLLRRAETRQQQVAAMAQTALDTGVREIWLQTYAEDADGIAAEGAAFAALDRSRVIAKIPATAAGFAAAARLTAMGILVGMTAVYTVRQALLAASVGASYAAVYLGRMRDAGIDPLEQVGLMRSALAAQRSGVEILAASVREPAEIDALAQLGVEAVTLRLDLLLALPDSALTARAAATFGEDAAAMG